METKDAILGRRSVRKFTDQQISDEQIKNLLTMAMASPSAINSQPWEFFVIKDKSKQDKIKSIKNYYDYNSPLLIVVAGNSHKFIKLLPGAEDFWIQDCASATSHLLIGAKDIGLETCWCGIYPLKNRIEKIKEILELDKKYIPFALIHVGYGKETKEPRSQYNEKKVHII